MRTLTRSKTNESTGKPQKFALWARVSTDDLQDPESSRAWQRRRASALVAPSGGEIVAEFFDIDKSRSVPPKLRPDAARLLKSLEDPGRGFDGVVIGEPQRVFYDSQFSETFPLFRHYEVPLWVPEVGGAIDPRNEAHSMIMSVFGGTSKAERTRIQIRVQSAMGAQVQYEGRWLGGRPPYGYTLEDLGPHPNPAKAADGKRLRRLMPDTYTAWVVNLIYALYLRGWGIGAIAEHLTSRSIPSPSAYDRRRNPHRSGIGWAKGAIRVILTNPRYTGFQVWGKQRKDEILIDVHDVSLGYTTKLKWNEREDWVWSEAPAHTPIIPLEVFSQVEDLMASRGRNRKGVPDKAHKCKHPYQLRTRLFCGVCERRMQGQWTNGFPYYRCRYPQEYALANEIDHPRNVYLKEEYVVPELDAWLGREFGHERLNLTIAAMAESQQDETRSAEERNLNVEIEACQRKLKQYREALDGGTEPSVVMPWINEVEADRRAAEVKLKRLGPPSERLDEETIEQMVRELGEIVGVLEKADPEDKADLYEALGLRLTYEPDSKKVRAEVAFDPHLIGKSRVSEGGLEPPQP